MHPYEDPFSFPEVLGAQGATWRVVVIDLGHRCLLSLWLRLERGRS